MKRTILSKWIVLVALGTAFVSIAEDKKANELLEAGLTKETIEGDIKGAITLYGQAVKEAGPNRLLSARAQLRLAGAYQKQGMEEARVIYDRLARDFSDLPEIDAAVRERLSVLRNPTLTVSNISIPLIIFQQRQITLFDRQGKMIGTIGDPGPNGTMALAPDAKRVALVRNGRILVFDVKTQVPITLTSGPGDTQPAWSADGKRIVFEARSGTSLRPSGLYTIASDGTGKEEFITSSPGNITLISWSADGRYLTYQQTSPQTGNDVFVLPVTGDKKPIPILATTAPELGLRISPDGRFISYRFNSGGRSEAYVSLFDPAADPARNIERWKISGDVSVATAGVRWRADGKEIYYIDANGGFNAVEVTTTPTFKASPPKVLFQVPTAYQQAPDNTAGFSDVSADGKTFALMVPR